MRVPGYLSVFLSLSLALTLTGCESLRPSLKASPSLFNAVGVASIPVKHLNRDYVSADSEFLEIDGLEVHYRDVGEGPVLYLLHGMMSSLHTWDPWVNELQDRFRIIYLDLPGFGLTGAPEDLDKFDIEYMLEIFEIFVLYMETEQFSIAGNSLGAYLAARYAADHPDQIEKLILLNPIGYGQEWPWQFKLAKAPVVGGLTRAIQPPFLITRTVRELYGDPERLTDAQHDRYIHMAQRPGAKAIYHKTMNLLMNQDDPAWQAAEAEAEAERLAEYSGGDDTEEKEPDADAGSTERPWYLPAFLAGTETAAADRDDNATAAGQADEADREGVLATARPTPFARIQAPTLVMWGEKDPWIPFRLARRWQADIPQSRLVTYPDVGHMPMEELPYQTAQDVSAFLADISPVNETPEPQIDELEMLIQGDSFSEGFEPMPDL